MFFLILWDKKESDLNTPIFYYSLVSKMIGKKRDIEDIAQGFPADLAERLDSIRGMQGQVSPLLQDMLNGLAEVYAAVPEDEGADAREKLLKVMETAAEYTMDMPDPKTLLPSSGASKRHFIRYIKNKKKAYEESRDSGERKQKVIDVGFLLMDIDNFSQFNDKYGHSVGDVVLNYIGRRLDSKTKSTDFISKDSGYENCLAREGGEEIYAILPETDLEGAAAAAARLVGCVAEEPITVQNLDKGVINHYDVSISCGVSGISVDLENMEDGNHDEILKIYGQLSQMADNALYDAKLNGKNQSMVYDPEKDYRSIRKAYNERKSGVHSCALEEKTSEM